MKVLALSGSLRALSINSALLRTAQRVAPPGIAVTLYTLLGTLPLFNPDLEQSVPELVVSFRNQVAEADALLIASPEYAHGVTGTIKNALDWLVSFEPFVGKPLAVVNTSPRAHHADAALRETLRTMSAVIVESASISLPLLGAHTSEGAMLEQAQIVQALKESLLALQRTAMQQRQPDAGPVFALEG